MTGAAAGVRSCLIVDMGWAETVVTSVYEYREVKHTRTVRAARLLLNNVYRELSALLSGETQSSQEGTDKSQNAERLLSFAECEDVMCRLVWCRPSSLKTSRQPVQLETVEEQDESDAEAANPPHSPKGSAKIPLRSTAQPTTVEMPFEKLADICDATFFPSAPSVSTFDDDELPLHMLVYLHLLQLPLDVRAVCMSRIIFTGGGSSILGIKERVMDEVTYLVETRGWEPVTGKGAEQVRTRAKSQGQAGSMNSSSVPLVTVEGSSRSQTEPEKDPLEAKLARHRKAGPPQVQGQLRALHSLGPWVGASLLSQLRIPALSTIDRELWLQHGVSGASKPGDVDVKAQQRQSMSAGGLIRGAGGHHNWTLGAWGAL
jgi:actin-related protein